MAVAFMASSSRANNLYLPSSPLMASPRPLGATLTSTPSKRFSAVLADSYAASSSSTPTSHSTLLRSPSKPKQARSPIKSLRPQTPSTSNNNANAKTPSAAVVATPSTGPNYRFLYRGSLSLPDSHLQLDGLTFHARLHPLPTHGGAVGNTPTSCAAATIGTPSSTANMLAEQELLLLENPLALALESMRGRPSLRFIGQVKLKDVYVDESAGIEMDIHPGAVLSKVYFENTFCLLPWSLPTVPKALNADVDDAQTQRSEIGIQVSLGDSDGPETTEMIIYAQRIPTPPPSPFAPASSSPSSSRAPSLITLHVARKVDRPIHPLPFHLRSANGFPSSSSSSSSSSFAPHTNPGAPPQQPFRLPRPDDPVQRKPPLALLRQNSTSGTTLVFGAAGPSKVRAREKPLKRTASSALAPSALSRDASVEFGDDESGGGGNGGGGGGHGGGHGGGGNGAGAPNAKRQKTTSFSSASGLVDVKGLGSHVRLGPSAPEIKVQIPPPKPLVGVGIDINAIGAGADGFELDSEEVTHEPGGLFKAPFTPTRFKGKEKEGEKQQWTDGKRKRDEMPRDSDGDIFSLGGGGSAKGREQKRAGVNESAHGVTTKAKEDEEEAETEVERANKNMIKRSTMNYLLSIKDPTTYSVMNPQGSSSTPASASTPSAGGAVHGQVPTMSGSTTRPKAAAALLKSNLEMKELWGMVYRGVGYSLRAQMKVHPFNPEVVDRLIRAHAAIYVDGLGGSCRLALPSSDQQQPLGLMGRGYSSGR